jgi:hypothetical protein
LHPELLEVLVVLQIQYHQKILLHLELPGDLEVLWVLEHLGHLVFLGDLEVLRHLEHLEYLEDLEVL